MDDFRVAAEDEDGSVVGYVSARLEEARYLSPSCRRALAALAERNPGLSLTRVYRVGRSYLAPSQRGRGMGVELYLSAVRMAALEGYAVVADDCVAPEGSRRTSEMARRVWSSRRFSQAADVEDMVATARER